MPVRITPNNNVMITIGALQERVGSIDFLEGEPVFVPLKERAYYTIITADHMIEIGEEMQKLKSKEL